MIKEGYNFNDIKHKIKPLDCILFRGNELVSKVIKKLERSKVNSNYVEYTHCGIVITRDLLDDYRLDPDKLYIWESTMSGKLQNGVYDIDGKAFLGVQIRKLDEVIEAFDKPNDTAVAWLKLKNNPMKEFSMRGEIREKFKIIYNEYNGRKYNINLLSLLSTVYVSLRPFRKPINKLFKTKDMIFCSQLVAIVYKELGLLDESVNPRNVLPIHFIPSISQDVGIPTNLMKFPVRITTDLHYSSETLVRVS